jgi:hypothetical protein
MDGFVADAPRNDRWALIAFPSKTFSDVIPDARKARDGESRAEPAILDWLWINGHAFGPPGMTGRANGSTGIRMA